MIELARQQTEPISIVQACRVLDVSRSWFYEHPLHQETPPEELALRAMIEEIALEFPGYGYRRIIEELHRRGEAVNHKRVLRILRRVPFMPAAQEVRDYYR